MNELSKCYSSFLATHDAWIQEKALAAGIDPSEARQQLFVSIHDCSEIKTADGPDDNAIKLRFERDLKNLRPIFGRRIQSYDESLHSDAHACYQDDNDTEPLEASVFENVLRSSPSFHSPQFRPLLEGILSRKSSHAIAENLGITHTRVYQMLNEFRDKVTARNIWDLNRDLRGLRDSESQAVNLRYTPLTLLRLPNIPIESQSVEELESLIIAMGGIVEPLIISPHYMVLHGAKRFLAARNLGLDYLPTLIYPAAMDATDEELLSIRSTLAGERHESDRNLAGGRWVSRLIPAIAMEIETGILSERVGRILAVLPVIRQETLVRKLGRSGIALLTEADAIRLVLIRIRNGGDKYFTEALDGIKSLQMSGAADAAVRGVNPRRHQSLKLELQRTQELCQTLQKTIDAMRQSATADVCVPA